METVELFKIADISNQMIKAKQSHDIYYTIKPSRRPELELDGWQFVPTKLKNSVRMRKSKTHFDAFEDRIWALCAKMKFSYLNKSHSFKLEYTQGLSKAIDVFAAEDEAILIIECKSSATNKVVNYQKDINELIGMKDGLRQAAQKLFKGKPKVAFVFATNQSILSETDEKRLSEGGVFHFNDASLEYWEHLIDHLGQAAKYQLFGKLFAGQDIPNLPNRVPAVKGKMADGNIFYSFSIEPKFLLRMGFILHRWETNPEATQAYQRLVKKKRIEEIGKYIDKGGYFPNSIIVNIVSKKQDLKWDPAGQIEHDSNTSMGIVHLPKEYRSVFIIDGQHRLYGYSKAHSDARHTVPVVAFLNLPQAEQAKIFVDINHKQQSVPTNLLRSIMADFNWNSDDAGLAISALKTRILTCLNIDDKSPFYNRVVLSEEDKNSTRCLTLETVMKWGLSSSPGYFGKVKNKKVIRSGHLTDVSHDDTLRKSLAFFNCCFTYIKDELQTQWDCGNGEGGFISMNIGVSAIMKSMDHVLDHLTKFDGLKAEELTGQQLADRVTPYLMSVVSFIKGLDVAGLNKIRSYFGSGAPEKVTREFLIAIHKDYPEFNPDGMQQWLKESSGQFNEPSWELGNSYIEPLMHDFIIAQLKRQFGEKSWWDEGIPPNIQKACFSTRLDQRSSEPIQNFLNTIHYKDIIKENSTFLINYFTQPGMENAAQDKKLSWLVKFNSIRQKYSHPQRDIITEGEYSYLKELFKWLQIKLKM